MRKCSGVVTQSLKKPGGEGEDTNGKGAAEWRGRGKNGACLYSSRKETSREEGRGTRDSGNSGVRAQGGEVTGA